jgi:hypothetical protein
MPPTSLLVAIGGVFLLAMSTLVFPAVVVPDDGSSYSLVRFPALIADVGGRTVSSGAASSLLLVCLLSVGLAAASTVLPFFGRLSLAQLLSLIACVPVSLFSLALISMGGGSGTSISLGLYLIPVGAAAVCGGLAMTKPSRAHYALDWFITALAVAVVCMVFLLTWLGMAPSPSN